MRLNLEDRVAIAEQEKMVGKKAELIEKITCRKGTACAWDEQSDSLADREVENMIQILCTHRTYLSSLQCMTPSKRCSGLEFGAPRWRHCV